MPHNSDAGREDACVPYGLDGRSGAHQASSIEAPQLRRAVILGVAASAAPAVANRLIEFSLRLEGFEVITLGVCTPIAAFAEAFERDPHAEAVLIGSLNGHAYRDLCELPLARERGLLDVPVVLGGNLSVGGDTRAAALDRLLQLGVDSILDGIDDIVPHLSRSRLAGVPA